MSTFERNRLIWTNPVVFIACGFGIGQLPTMPGTYATIAAIPLCLLLGQLPLLWHALTLLWLIVSGIWLCGYANRCFGTDDHPAAVWDEICCFPVVMFAVPNTAALFVLGILLFRVLDIWKPGPIGWIDKHIHGGIGVILDDLVAALLAAVIVFMVHML